MIALENNFFGTRHTPRHVINDDRVQNQFDCIRESAGGVSYHEERTRVDGETDAVVLAVDAADFVEAVVGDEG